MDSFEVTQAVCRMALDHHRLRDRSMLDLLNASGYVQHHHAVSESKLREVFEANPDLIQTWLDYSLDQRTSEGYYILAEGVLGWVVGRVPDGKDKRFPDSPTACARFVKLEAEQLRCLLPDEAAANRS